MSALGRGAAWVLVGLLVLPLLALALDARPGDLVEGWRRGLLAPALGLSLGTTTLTAALLALAGTPLAWWLARAEGIVPRAVEQLCRLPVVTPPAVAGVALLSAFGRQGLLGGVLAELGLPVAFTPAAVVVAQLFVAAPFFVVPAAEAFRAVDEDLLLVARTLGASRERAFFRVALPMSARALASALGVAWARALGEFGATLMVAGNLRGRTQTLPLAIYSALESDVRLAQALSLVLLVLAVLLFFGFGRAVAVPRASR